MIRHTVFFTVKSPTDAETVFDGLNLLKDNPHANHFEVGCNLKTDRISADGPDFIVYAEFSDEDQLNAYKAHPLYQKSISIVRPLRDKRIAADFLSDA